MVKALVIDLDGVVRHWQPLTPVEARFGLATGTVLSIAFEPARLERVITGRVSDDAWRDEVAEVLRERFAVDGAAVVAQWSQPCGVVDAHVVQVVRRARRSLAVALLTNATSRLDQDLARLGLADEFDVVFNSSEIGMAKPDPELFGLIAAAMGVDVAECVFVDDTPGHVAAASAVGMVAYHYLDPEGLEHFLTPVIGRHR